MSEELTPTELIVLPIDEQISQELVKANVTEAIIADLRERLLPLKIAGIDDKETYLTVKEGRKECKALRVAAKKICTNGREQAVAISKAWIAKEKDVTGRIAVVEDYLEKQEVEYEAKVAKEKEDRKRKQEEQLIIRQQTLAAMGVLYSEGNFTLGEVSFDFSLIKESEEDVWCEAILPKFKEEYEKVQAEQIEQRRKELEKEAELIRQQQELEQKKKELAEEATRLQQEADRQRIEANAKKEAQAKERIQQLSSLGFVYNGIEYYKVYDFVVFLDDVHELGRVAWLDLISQAEAHVKEKRAEETEEKRKEQERQELQNKRYAELYPYVKYGNQVEMGSLWSRTEDEYMGILEGKKAAFQKAEEERNKQIAEAAAKAERERIEEEQRHAEVKRKEELRKSRVTVLNHNQLIYFNENGHLEGMSEDEWLVVFNRLKSDRDEVIRKQEEEKKVEMFAQASDKMKWAEILTKLQEVEIYDMRSGQYRKKTAILREKLEEIKAL